MLSEQQHCPDQTSQAVSMARSEETRVLLHGSVS